ncbi:PVC-type heme-binding CxxCH protein [Pararhodonellum marinum]|uniref:PVC-type heme-binding CxxCH protein n=1 Tax=Pararhodonellum marinum TaxID=2755358 RepID=UPI00188F55B6|nr:PVC-type heme-binding CxxCH protein [Pararhodonellum marinum]
MKFLFTSCLRRYLIPFLLILCCFFYACKNDNPIQEQLPAGVKVLDPRLDLSVAVEDPDIVTPVGIAIDKRDRVFVLESHTHLQPKDYAGPDGDLIKVFEDSNGDGNLDKTTIFAEGILEGLNLAFSPEGHLYLVTSREVWVFYDSDGDGVSEERQKLLELTKPDYVYPHAALLSIAFSPDGWMYIGRGNTGSDLWIMEGTDGNQVSGFGDGGNIIRAKWNGSEVEIFSTGYWNPFDLKFDDYGRLLVADNDPDSRGPNRLVHAVQGSDFGYQSLFGGSGIHPYLAWDGELPGTLPIAVPLGEAPSGLLNANFAALPADYQDQMLCTIWEESNIVRVNFREQGMSLTGEAEVIVQGGEEFRPVSFASDSKGNIYFTDWVIRYYPNHGRGKIWKMTTKQDVPLLKRSEMYQAPVQDKMQPLLSLTTATWEDILKHLVSDDPFEVHAAQMAMGQHPAKIQMAAKDNHPSIRMAALLTAMRSGDESMEYLVRDFLRDKDAEVRKMALIWVGSAQLTAYKNEIETVLTAGPVNNDLFQTYLETVKLLQPEFVNAYQSREITRSNTLPRSLPEGFVSEIVRDASKPSGIRVFAFRYLEDLGAHQNFLLSFLEKNHESEIRLETVRTLQGLPDKAVAAKLLEMALDTSNPEIIRSDALAVLAAQPLDDWERIIPLLDTSEENIRTEAARYLRSKISRPEVREAFEKRKDNASPPNAFQQQLLLGLEQQMPGRPDKEEEALWQELLEGKADSERGRRVFFSNTSLCATCHQMDGKGGDLGPDLSQVGRSKDRRGLISSILYPSAEMSPEWQGWYILLKDGNRLDGRQIDVGNNDIKLYTQSKGFVSVDKKDIADYGMIKASLMPDGLEQRLSDQDLRDLLAYLQGNP